MQGSRAFLANTAVVKMEVAQRRVTSVASVARRQRRRQRGRTLVPDLETAEVE